LKCDSDFTQDGFGVFLDLAKTVFIENLYRRETSFEERLGDLRPRCTRCVPR